MAVAAWCVAVSADSSRSRRRHEAMKDDGRMPLLLLLLLLRTVPGTASCMR